MRARDGLLVVALLAACAATRSGPSGKQREYLKAHPLSPDEERRLFAREARRGDTIDRVRVTCDDCDFERVRVDGDIEIWRVHLPVDVRPLRITTDRLEEISPGSDLQLIFRRQLLDSALIF